MRELAAAMGGALATATSRVARLRRLGLVEAQPRALAAGASDSVLGVPRPTLAALVFAASLMLVSPAAARPAGADGPEAATGAAKRPGLFAGEYPVKFRVRPTVVGGWTNDGSGFLAGADGNPPASFGHVKWTRWNSKTARGRGLVWATTDRTTWHSPTVVMEHPARSSP